MQKDDFNPFIPATSAIFSGANPALVVRRRMAKDIQSLNANQNTPLTLSTVLVYTNMR